MFPFVLPSFAPTAVPLVLPSCLRLWAFPSFLLSFVRFHSVLITQSSVFPFPSSRFPLSAVLPVPIFPLPSSLLPCLSSDSSTQFTAISFLRLLSRLTVATSAPQPFGLFPLACALGSGYSAGSYLAIFPIRFLVSSDANSNILALPFLFVNTFFKVFLIFFNFF